MGSQPPDSTLGVKSICFTATSHDRHGVSNDRLFHRLFNRLFRRTSKTTLKLYATDSLLGESTGGLWIPITKGQQRGKRSMWWRHRGWKLGISVSYHSRDGWHHRASVVAADDRSISNHIMDLFFLLASRVNEILLCEVIHSDSDVSDRVCEVTALVRRG